MLRARQWLLWLGLVGLFAGFSARGEADSLEVVLRDGRVSLRASGQPLPEVLHAFQAQGVEVRLDPGVQAEVRGKLTDVPVGKALAQLLGSYSYSLGWEHVEGPVEGVYRLATIRVFRPGYAGQAKRLEGKAAGLDVITLPDGRRVVRGEVLIGLKEGMPLSQFKELLARVNGEVVESIPALGVYRVRIPRDASVVGTADLLRQFASVAVAEPNGVVDVPRAVPVAGASGESVQASVPAAPQANGVAVAVLDSGLSGSVDLGQSLTGAYDAMNPGGAVADGSGHGTQMAMIATGAIAPKGTTVDAQGVPTLAIRAFDDEGMTSNFSLMQSIDYALENDARVMSLSWGTPDDSEFVARSIGYAQDKGMVVLAAAGNEPTGQPLYPAAYDGVVAVGATDATGAVWEQSNYGSFLDVVAPGTASFPVGHDGPPGSYAGTSISTPWVARAMSQYLTTYPQATNDQMLQAFEGSLVDANSPGRDDRTGNGIFNDAAKVRFLQTAPK